MSEQNHTRLTDAPARQHFAREHGHTLTLTRWPRAAAAAAGRPPPSDHHTRSNPLALLTRAPARRNVL